MAYIVTDDSRSATRNMRLTSARVVVRSLQGTKSVASMIFAVKEREGESVPKYDYERWVKEMDEAIALMKQESGTIKEQLRAIRQEKR